MSGCVEGPVVGANVTLDDDDDGEVSAKTDFSEIPLKDVVIVMFMLILWLYSIMLMLRAWAKIHNLPGQWKHVFPCRLYRSYLNLLRKLRHHVFILFYTKDTGRVILVARRVRKAAI